MNGADARRPLWAALVVLLLCCIAQPIAAAPIGSLDWDQLPILKVRMVSARSGNVIQTTRVWIERTRRDDEPLVALHATTALQTGSTLESRALLRPGPVLRCLEEEHRVRSADGVTRATIARQFRADALQFGGRPVPEDTYPLNEGMLYLLGHLPLDGAGAGSFHLLGPVQAFKLDIWKHGSEEVTVPAGRFQCDHMRMRPDPVSLNLPAVLRPFAALILPEFNVWIARQPPNLTVRVTGPFGPPNDRDVVLELVGTEGGR